MAVNRAFDWKFTMGDTPRYQLEDLITIMKQLRDPEKGCPWDIKQTFATIAPYTIEEAYEVDDAIRQGDMESLKNELGDLLFQTVFHSQMAAEAGHFTIHDVIEAISDKMIRRHPHVFGDGNVEDADAQTSAWESQKANERAEKAAIEGRTPSVLDDVGNALPALLRANKLQKRAARVGFDWTNPQSVLDKVEEEVAELREALDSGAQSEIAEEYGDLLFAFSNLARHLKLDPEESLRDANAKFERRFRGVEADLSERGTSPKESSLDDMEAAWQRVKASEKAL